MSTTPKEGKTRLLTPASFIMVSNFFQDLSREDALFLLLMNFAIGAWFFRASIAGPNSSNELEGDKCREVGKCVTGYFFSLSKI